MRSQQVASRSRQIACGIRYARQSANRTRGNAFDGDAATGIRSSISGQHELRGEFAADWIKVGGDSAPLPPEMRGKICGRAWG